MIYSLSNGDVANNVYHVVQDTPQPFIESDALALADSFNTEFWDDFKTVIADNCVLSAIEVSDASGLTGLSYEFPFAEPGGSASAPLPFQIAYVASLRTSLNTRRGRGRSYHVGFTTASNSTNGNPLSATKNTLAAAYVSLQADLTALGYALCVYSRADDVAREVTSVIIDGRWDVQRRRANSAA
jgi:hypothetical protein